ncbi:MAG: DUF2334 domain-containing protein [Thermoleophilia bacterium]
MRHSGVPDENEERSRLSNSRIAGRLVGISLLLALFAVFLISDANAEDTFTKTGTEANQARTALIISDNSYDEAVVLEELLGHFSIPARVVSTSDYAAGSLQDFDLTFFVKQDNTKIRADILGDFEQTRKPLIWIGYGFNQFSRGRSVDRYGFTASDSTLGGFTNVEYNGRSMSRTVSEADIVTVTNPAVATVRAKMTGKSTSAPYVVQGANLWLVADVPLMNTTQYSSYLVLADLLHEMVGVTNHPVNHLALIRIEDVHPKVQQDKLRAIADYLYSEKIPFSVALIPVYENPFTGERATLSDSPEFIETINYMQEKGASIVLHGYTHQYIGESAVDYEFWRGSENREPRAESDGWVKGRLQAAQQECWDNGIYPIAWETPHYTSTDFTQEIIARYFPVSYGRRGQNFYPYILETNRSGQKVIPETMGYVRIKEDAGVEPQVPQTGELISVRDGIASAFFHPFMDLALLKELTTEVRRDGFDYVSLTSLTDNRQMLPVEMSKRDGFQAWVSNMKQVVEAQGTPGLSWMSLTGFILLIYYALIFGLGRKVRDPDLFSNPKLQFIFVIPALNEELVIGATLDRLLSLPDENVRVIVMNDNSDDRTAEIVEKYKSDRCILVNRSPEIARQGKGHVLNHAYEFIKTSDIARIWGKGNIILAVLDADGQVKQNIIKAVTPYFLNSKTGAVQASVRIFNDDVNILTRWQQFEFLTFNRIFQRGRERIGSVGLGGNGQFVRLSALETLGDEPWSDCLTEDLDIGIRLMLDGWDNHFAGNTFVAQQAVTNFRALVRQRSRWFQGHVTCWIHIPGILKSDLRLATRIDTIYYLLGITMVFLFFPATLLFLLGAFFVLATGAASVGDLFYGGFWPYLLLLYLLSFGPLPVMAVIYWKEDGKVSLVGAFIRAHIFTVVYYVWFLAGCIAIFHLARGERSWAKTERTKQPARV